MIKLEGLFFNEHTPDSSEELMSESKDSLFEGEPFGSSLVVVFPEVFIMHNEL